MIYICKLAFLNGKDDGNVKDLSGQMSDEVLCQAAAMGDRSAEGVLISRYLRLVQKLAYQYRGILDFEDLVQEGCIGLLNAIGGFDPARDVHFSSYAYICIRNRMFRAMRDSSSGEADIVPLEDSMEGVTPDPEQLFLGREQLRQVMDSLEELLSPMEKKIFLAHLGGFDYQTIADTLHISLKSVDNALQRVRKKLKTIDPN